MQSEIFNLEYNYCYPDSMSSEIFSLSDLYSIPGEGPVLFIDMTASWCPTCFDPGISVVDGIYESFQDELNGTCNFRYIAFSWIL